MRARLASTFSPCKMRSITSTPRVEPTRRALAAGLKSAEFHGKAGLAGHIHAIVKDHHAAMADETVLRGEGLIIKGRIKQRRRKISTQRPAHLHGTDRPTACGAAADLLHQITKGEAEGGFKQAGIANVPGKLDRHCPARPAVAEIPICFGTVGQNPRHGSKCDDVVDHGGFAEQAGNGRQRRLGANLAAFASMLSKRAVSSPQTYAPA